MRRESIQKGSPLQAKQSFFSPFSTPSSIVLKGRNRLFDFNSTPESQLRTANHQSLLATRPSLSHYPIYEEGTNNMQTSLTTFQLKLVQRHILVYV